MNHGTRYYQIAVILIVLTGCAAAPSTAAQPPAPVALPAPTFDLPITFAAAGDSITSWNPAFAHDPSRTWVSTANSGDLALVGGWAVPGAYTAAMAEGMAPVQADVLVVMAGTNDVYGATPVDQSLANVRTIVEKSKVSRVVISSTAPLNAFPAEGAAWNDQLRALAHEEGWEFIDPWKVIRTDDNRYPVGMSPDGVHPTAATAAVVGQYIKARVLQMFIPTLDVRDR